MFAAANNLEFEKAALMRDQIRELKRTLDGSLSVKTVKSVSLVRYGRQGRRVKMPR